jgi:hypothetical protein
VTQHELAGLAGVVRHRDGQHLDIPDALRALRDQHAGFRLLQPGPLRGARAREHRDPVMPRQRRHASGVVGVLVRHLDGGEVARVHAAQGHAAFQFTASKPRPP